MLNNLLTTPISKKSRSAPKGCYPMQNTSALLFPLLKTETPAFMEGSRMDDMQGAEGEGEWSVLAYVTKPESRKQRRRSPFCNFLLLFFDSSLDVANSVANGLDVLRHLILDVDVKNLLKLHNKLYSIERVGTKIIGEASCLSYLARVYVKLIYDDLYYLVCNFLSCHGKSFVI